MTADAPVTAPRAGNEADLKARLVGVASALDEGEIERALDGLRDVPLVRAHPATRLVAASLWKQALTAAAAKRSAGADEAQAYIKPFGRLVRALEDPERVWDALAAVARLEKKVGSADAAHVAASVAWDLVLDGPEGAVVATLELFHRGDALALLREGWLQCLGTRKDFVPGYWLFLLLAKAGDDGDPQDHEGGIFDDLRTVGRGELRGLFDVYLLLKGQADPGKIVEAALSLEDPDHRARVSECMTGMGYMTADIRPVVAAFPRLLRDPERDSAAIAYMEARLATGEERWSDCLDLATAAAQESQFRHAAELLCANALANLGRTREARERLATIRDAEDAPWFLRARASYISLTVAQIERGMTLPQYKEPPSFPDLPGRPLAQSLWVGRRLRWIERLAIRSYLDNGWRFQLYVYEDPEGVPDGCEVLDAGAIIPEREVFREGAGSGLHAGSIGAFSDLFRYRLLYQRGGMWTDTDVINFRKFDPEGMRFVSTEVADAGMYSTNGAIMAAPAGDPFVERAYERADQLLKADGMYFTRIGPHLLADLLLEDGLDRFTLMPPGFLSAISWMNTGVLRWPYEEVAARPEFRSATNLHVYTEMWRLLGLGLDRPPGPGTYLGRLYADHFGVDHSGAGPAAS